MAALASSIDSCAKSLAVKVGTLSASLAFWPNSSVCNAVAATDFRRSSIAFFVSCTPDVAASADVLLETAQSIAAPAARPSTTTSAPMPVLTSNPRTDTASAVVAAAAVAADPAYPNAAAAADTKTEPRLFNPDAITCRLINARYPPISGRMFPASGAAAAARI